MFSHSEHSSILMVNKGICGSRKDTDAYKLRNGLLLLFPLLFLFISAFLIVVT